MNKLLHLKCLSEYLLALSLEYFIHLGFMPRLRTIIDILELY